MYVPGTVLDCEKVIIDIGTGYYIEKVYYLSLTLVNLIITFVC